MSTTKASILTLASMLCYGLGDTAEMDRLYYEVERELARDPRMWQAGTVSGASTFQLDRVGINTLAVHAIFYQGRQLVEVAQTELDAVNPHWRDEVGMPYAYTRAFFNTDLFRLYPQRNDDNAASSEVLFFRTATSDNPVVSILELPFALFVLAREFARESPHRDMVFAQECNKLGNELLAMVA